jgi:hypothetical protein
MGVYLLVTVGSDGATNWVRTPDGRKFNLGPVSVLNFVTKLCLGGQRESRRILDKFLSGEEVMLRVDEGRMWNLMTPRRRRWAMAHPFIPVDQQTSQGKNMDTIGIDLDGLLEHINVMKRVAGKVSAEKMAEGTDILKKFVAKIIDQSSNSAYYGLGVNVFEASEDSGVVDSEDAGAAKVASGPNTGEMVVGGILMKMAEIDEKIGQLEKAGKKFDSVEARLDIHDLCQKVASLTASTELMESWALEDLVEYQKQADQLHGLFFPKIKNVSEHKASNEDSYYY